MGAFVVVPISRWAGEKAAWVGRKEQKQTQRRRKWRPGSVARFFTRLRPRCDYAVGAGWAACARRKKCFNSILFHIFSFKNNINQKWWFKYYCVNYTFFSFWREVLKLFLVSIMNKCIFKRFNNQSVSYNNYNLIICSNNSKSTKGKDGWIFTTNEQTH